jgi:hypothetical protein
MSTAPVATASATELTINELALTKADAITLAELLESELIADTVVRSICIIRKTLISKDIKEPEDQQLEAKLSALYHALGIQTRDIAHQIRRDRLAPATARSAMTQPPVQATPNSAQAAAPKLQLEPAIAYATAAVAALRDRGTRIFSNELLREEFARRRLAGGLQWHSADLILLDPDTPQWHRTLAGAMEHLKNDEIVIWSNKRNRWVILES